MGVNQLSVAVPLWQWLWSRVPGFWRIKGWLDHDWITQLDPQIQMGQKDPKLAKTCMSQTFLNHCLEKNLKFKPGSLLLEVRNRNRQESDDSAWSRLRCRHPWDSTWESFSRLHRAESCHGKAPRFQNHTSTLPPNPTWALDALVDWRTSNVKESKIKLLSKWPNEGHAGQPGMHHAVLLQSLLDNFGYLIDLGRIRFQNIPKMFQTYSNDVESSHSHSSHVLQFQAFQWVHLQQAADHVLGEPKPTGTHPRPAAPSPSPTLASSETRCQAAEVMPQQPVVTGKMMNQVAISATRIFKFHLFFNSKSETTRNLTWKQQYTNCWILENSASTICGVKRLQEIRAILGFITLYLDIFGDDDHDLGYQGIHKCVDLFSPLGYFRAKPIWKMCNGSSHAYIKNHLVGGFNPLEKY